VQFAELVRSDAEEMARGVTHHRRPPTSPLLGNACQLQGTLVRACQQRQQADGASLKKEDLPGTKTPSPTPRRRLIRTRAPEPFRRARRVLAKVLDTKSTARPTSSAAGYLPHGAGPEYVTSTHIWAGATSGEPPAQKFTLTDRPRRRRSSRPGFRSYSKRLVPKRHSANSQRHRNCRYLWRGASPNSRQNPFWFPDGFGRTIRDTMDTRFIRDLCLGSAAYTS